MKFYRQAPGFFVSVLLAISCSNSSKTGNHHPFGTAQGGNSTAVVVTFSQADVQGVWSFTQQYLTFEVEYGADGARVSGDASLPDAITVTDTGAVSGRAALHGGSGATVWTGIYTYNGQLAQDKANMSGTFSYRRTGTSGTSESSGVWSAVKIGGPSQPAGTGGASSIDAAGGTGVGGAAETGGAASTGGAEPTTLEQAARVVAEAHSASVNRCDAQVVNLNGGIANFSDRVAMRYAWESSLPDTGMTIAGLQSCATALSQLSCAELMASAPAISDCRFQGTRATGAVCLAGSQCATGYCNTPDYTCGICAEVPVLGAACNTDQQCAPGQACAAADHCYTPQRNLGPCSDAEPCDYAHTCVNGTCQANAPSFGSACDPAVGNPWCVTGLVCNTSSHRCVTRMIAEPGQTCGWSGSSTWFECAYLSGCPSNGTACPPRPVAGSACDEANGQYCDSPDKCMGGVCVAPPAFASACPQ